MAVDLEPTTQEQPRPVQAKFPIDKAFRAITAACCCVIVLILAGIIFELWRNSQLSMRKFGWGFLTSSAWDPVSGHFGALSSIYGTLVSTAIALVIAVPMSLVIALFLVELAPKKLSGIFGTAIELLAAIPSIIYGMWGLFVFAPFMANYVEPFLGKYPRQDATLPGTSYGNWNAHRRDNPGAYDTAVHILGHARYSGAGAACLERIGLRSWCDHLGSDQERFNPLRHKRNAGGGLSGTRKSGR